MEKVTIDDVDIRNSPLGVHSERRPVSDALNTESFAMNFFRLAPNESFSGGLHTHHDQEEVFFVESGVATFEIGQERDEIDVSAGELIRFAPGEFQAGWNHGEDPVVGWALGAPDSQHDWDAIRSIVYCRNCEKETAHGLELTDEAQFRMTCTECKTSFTT